MTNLKIKILESLDTKTIRMIPRWKFLLYSSLGILGIFFLLLVTIFLGSLILFVLSRYGVMSMPMFEFMRTLRTLDAIPLILMVCTIVLLIGVELMTRYYAFSFKRPLAITLLALSVFVMGTSFLISQTPMHEYVRDYAREHKLPFMEKAYRKPASFKRVGALIAVRGTVATTDASTTVLRLFDGDTFIAYTSTTTPKDMYTSLKIGDDIVFLGIFREDGFIITDIKNAPAMFFKKEHSRRDRFTDDQKEGMKNFQEMK